jgi:predicted metal-dependent phosphoesterase TrpH
VVEVFNARLHPGHLNEPAEGLAERHGRLRGAGSDAHIPSEVAGAYVEVPYHANEPKALLAALAHGRVQGKMSHRAVHLASTWAKLRKRLPGAAGVGS